MASRRRSPTVPAALPPREAAASRRPGAIGSASQPSGRQRRSRQASLAARPQPTLFADAVETPGLARFTQETGGFQTAPKGEAPFGGLGPTKAPGPARRGPRNPPVVSPQPFGKFFALEEGLRPRPSGPERHAEGVHVGGRTLPGPPSGRGPDVRGDDNRPKGDFGWGTWIRTRTNGVRVRGSTVNLFPSSAAVT